MSYRPRTTARRTRSTFLVALVVVGAGLAGFLVFQSSSTSSSLVVPPSSAASSSTAASPSNTRHDRRHTVLGAADGVVSGNVTVFDDKVPAVAKLAPELLGALRKAAKDARDDGIEFFVTSGWRSPAYQEQLLHEAVAKYGSEGEAARWVATPETSLHVKGEAVDLGHDAARTWLSEHGAEYGLCQIYRNEPWHYELRPKASDDGCPTKYADPTQDPRMRS